MLDHVRAHIIAHGLRDPVRRCQQPLYPVRDALAGLLRELPASFLPLEGHAIGQATGRVLQGQSVPAAEKLLSLFEPHTQVIQRHKPGHVVEFGRKLWLNEVDGGLASR
jgi:hypothetical protein